MRRLAGLLLLGAAPVSPGFDIAIPAGPMAAAVNGVPTARHELHLTNFASTALEVKRIEILAEGRVVVTLSGDALAIAMGKAGTSVAPGRRGIAYIDAPLTARAIRHRVTWGEADGERSATTREVAVDFGGPVLSPPLRGGPWAAVYTLEGERGHRRVIYTTAGAARVPGRFAIDWIRVDDRGRWSAGDGKRPGEWYGYGAEALAVADGTVVAVRDGVAEPDTVDKGLAGPAEDAAGNHVAIDIGGGRYAFYEHLRPGVPVKIGQRVRRGQVVGRLGFSGLTTGPHLHFHLADANSSLDAEGLPYVLSGATRIGGYASIEAFGRQEAWRRTPEARGQFFPAPNQVVRFEPPGTAR